MMKHQMHTNVGIPIKPIQFAVALICLIFSSVSIAQDSESKSSDQDWLSGDLELGLNTGRSDIDGDIEADQLLRLKIDPPKHDKLHLRSTLWTTEDLDGRESQTSSFRGLNDTSDTWVNTRLLTLYVELEGETDDSRLRFGRQRIIDGVAYNRIDGAYFKYRQSQWEYYAFLGARASIYENSHDDVSSGTGLSWRPAPATRLAIDVFYGKDERRQFNTEHVEATSTSLSIRHGLNAYHNLFGRATWHEEKLDEFRLMAQGVFDEDALLYTLAYRKRVSTIVERPAEFPQFYQVVGELNGYQDVSGVLSIPFGQRFELGLEAQLHDAENSRFGTGNRDYRRYGISLDIDDIAQHYNARIILEFWDAAEGESEKTVSAELSRDWTRTRASIGIDYDRFQDRIIQYGAVTQDAFVIESKDDLYVLYMKIRHDINEKHAVQLRASVEDDDTSEAPYWRTRIQYTFRF